LPGQQQQVLGERGSTKQLASFFDVELMRQGNRHKKAVRRSNEGLWKKQRHERIFKWVFYIINKNGETGG